MGMIKWVKPSGLKIETNDKDATVEYCESLGWKQSNGKKPRKPRTPKTPIVEDNEGALGDTDGIVEGSGSDASDAVTDIPNQSDR